MLTASALYRQALPAPHRRVVRVEVFHGGVKVGDFVDTPESSVPFVVSGSVRASLTSRVTRTLAMTVDPQYYPLSSTDLLSPEVAVLRVSAGIGYPDGSYEVFPVFTGRVFDVLRDASGAVEVQGEDLAADVVDFLFEQPQASVTTNTIVTEIRRLITQVLPDAVFGPDDVSDAPTPTLVWDVDRGQALDDLATAVQGRWYALGNGSFVVRQYPYAGATPVIALVDRSGGVNMTASIRKSRIGVPNSVTVVSERMDGSAPIRATERDNDPSSPTFFGGPYGKVSQVIKVQTPLSLADAQALAASKLSTGMALGEQWSISCIPDYTLEPADVIDATYRDVSAVQVIDSIEYPLGLGSMALTCRSSVAASTIG